MKMPKASQCACGQWYTGQASMCPSCRKVTSKKAQNPLYNSYYANKYHRLWDSYEDFYREVGDPPTPGHVLRGVIPGTSISPGNVRWMLVEKLEDLNLHELTPVELMLDPEMRRLAAQSFEENAETPFAKMTTLRRIEKEFEKEAKPEDPIEWQLQIEKASNDYSLQLKREADSKQAEKGRGSGIRVGRSLRRKLLPGLAIRLSEHHKSAILQRAGRHHALIKPFLEKFEDENGVVDYELIAHITLTCVLNSVGRGSRMSTPMVKVLKDIGSHLDHQAFLEEVKQKEPQAWNRIDRYCLQAVEKGYTHKIKKAFNLSDQTYAFMDSDQHVKIGEWCFMALQSITCWFDTIRWYTGKGRGRFQYYLGLSEEGIKQIDLIQTAVDEYCYEAWPMVTKPLRWSREERGGYLKYHPGKVSTLIHNDMGTDPSPTALEALHRAQEVAFRVNRFIYETEINLLSKSEEIGSFRTYEKDSWEDQHRPRIHPSVWENKYDEHRNERPEHKEAIQALKDFYSEQKRTEKQYSKAPFRVLKVAARFLNVERFYLPCYFDTRLRLYYTVDTITPNGSDYQKALLMSADGKEITDENREQIRRDLLITLANTWAQKEDGVKTDKMTYEDRVRFGETFIRELEGVAKDPLTTSSRVLWTGADEPFQFLACVREYYETMVWKSKTHTHLFIGRDATNSGMQILGAISRDEKACYYTNVIPSDTPQDLYGEVAREAQALLRSDVWTHRKIKKYLKEAKKKMEKRTEEGQSFTPPDYSNFFLGMDVNRVDRSILKKAVMCTSYGASWSSKNEYISSEIEDTFENDPYNPSLTDKRLVTDAAIEGQSAAFPQCDILNKWFKDFGKACMEAGQELVEWRTPNGSLIVQEYREPVYKLVKTHAMGNASYYQVTSRSDDSDVIRYAVRSGYGAVKENKASTALGANWTHSLDACLLQNTISEWDRPFFTVHDCFYGLAGDMDDFCARARSEFKRVVEDKPMHTLVECNDIDIELPPMGDADLSECINADYMFC